MIKFIFLLSALFPAFASASSYHCDGDCKKIFEFSRTSLSSLEANQSRISGIEMILAAPSSIHPYDRWGHVLLRFVIADGSPANDLVLEFDAHTSKTSFSYIGGLFGGYVNVPVFETLQSFWKEYISDEDRDLTRSIIPTTPAMRARILQTLENWMDNPQKDLRDYTFFNNNCAGVMTRFLEDAGFPYSGIRARIPEHVQRYLGRLLLNPYPPLTVTSPVALINQTAKLLSISVVDLMAGRWPVDAVQMIQNTLTSDQILTLLEVVPTVPASANASLREAYGTPTGLQLAEILGIAPVPAALYGICANQACVQNLVTLEASIWSADELAAAKKSRAQTAHRTLSHPHESVLRASDVVQHFDLLLEADSSQAD